MTRNRPAAIRQSLPRIFRQSRPASRIIVVDSSDDPKPIRDIIRECRQSGNGPEIVHVESEKGMTRQRNVGLDMVKAPVVMYPDDDSMWNAETARHIMDVYEADSGGVVGGVCGRDTQVAQELGADGTWRELGESGSGGGEYKVGLKKRVEYALVKWYTRRGRPMSLNPFDVLGDSLRSQFEPLPAALVDLDIVNVKWMTGYRMSFRTECIRKIRFDEFLSDYSLFEDVSASFGVMSAGYALIGARKAFVEHRRFPGARGDAFRIGAMQVLNRAYVVCRWSDPGSSSRSSIRRASLAKVLSCGLRGVTDTFERARMRGAFAAMRQLSGIIEAAPTDAASRYMDAMAAIGLPCSSPEEQKVH